MKQDGHLYLHGHTPTIQLQKMQHIINAQYIVSQLLFQSTMERTKNVITEKIPDDNPRSI